MGTKKVLITGGLGFIGSHTVVELLQAGFEVVIVDELTNSQLFILDRIKEITGVKPSFYQFDVADRDLLEQVFAKEGAIDLVIHFAAFKAAVESVNRPLKYFRNNLFSLVNVLEVMKEYSCKNMVFSSSATVYGQPDKLPVNENAPLKKTLSAYGSTKQMGEDILEKVSAAEGMNVISLRYFNPVGAHASALIGELPIGTPNNLMPVITQVAAGLRDQVTVFGDDYATPDGTCIRDYIHVVDLAKAHLRSCDRLLNVGNRPPCEVFNIATGNGISVLEIIDAFEKYNDTKLHYSIGPRRPGDAAALFADASLAQRVLGWKAELGLKEMVSSAWEWQKQLTRSKILN